MNAQASFGTRALGGLGAFLLLLAAQLLYVNMPASGASANANPYGCTVGAFTDSQGDLVYGSGWVTCNRTAPGIELVIRLRMGNEFIATEVCRDERTTSCFGNTVPRSDPSGVQGYTTEVRAETAGWVDTASHVTWR